MAAGEIRLRGAHNVLNAMAGAAVCLARGVAPEAVVGGLRTFAGVAHRLQELGSREGVLYVNDSKATNVASTLVALDAFADARGTHLILGGQGKGQRFEGLREPVSRSCRAVYLIGEDARLIADALHGEPDAPARMRRPRGGARRCACKRGAGRGRAPVAGVCEL